MEISSEHFHRWKQEPVTIEVMALLEEVITNLNEGLLSESVILGDRSDKQLSNIVGKRDALRYVLDLTIDDFKKETEDEA